MNPRNNFTWAQFLKNFRVVLIDFTLPEEDELALLVDDEIPEIVWRGEWEKAVRLQALSLTN